jgi:hypothetical protein
MCRTAIAVLILALICLLAPSLGQAADKVGNWNGDRLMGNGGEVGYIWAIQISNAPMFGNSWQEVTLEPYSAEAVWTTDSTTAYTTGWWNLANWMGKTGARIWQTSDTAVVAGSKTLKFTLAHQVAPTYNGPWYTYKTSTIQDSVQAVHVDTLDFQTDAVMRLPFHRDVITGSTGNMKAKLSTFTEYIKLERTGTQ